MVKSVGRWQIQSGWIVVFLSSKIFWSTHRGMSGTSIKSNRPKDETGRHAA